MKDVWQLMRQAVEGGVFPGGVLLVARDGIVELFEAFGQANVFTGKRVTRETMFDLASLTKPLATTLAVMVMVHQARLHLSQRLADFFPEFEANGKSHIRIGHLLTHTSGLPAYQPYFRSMCAYSTVKSRQKAMWDLIVREPLINRPGHRTIYSDLGFIILGELVTRLTGQSLSKVVKEYVFDPLDLKDLVFPGQIPVSGNVAATELCPWRRMVIQGEVHDENCWMMGGIAGHAGLFGNAMAVYTLLQEILTQIRGMDSRFPVPRQILLRFLPQHRDTPRFLGFDAPDPIQSSCGRFFSPWTAGHLGFTGTSFWMDMQRQIIVILLTNRVHPCRENIRIRGFRPKLHDCVMKNLATYEKRNI